MTRPIAQSHVTQHRQNILAYLFTQLPEIYIEGVEEIDDVHAEDAVDGTVAHEREVGRVFASNVQSAVGNGFSEGE